MLPHLLKTRRFLPLFVCQFLSALNDNFVKNALVILILYKLGSETSGLLVTLAGATLIIPFFFLSALGGELADKFDKSHVAQYLKLSEIPIAMLAAAGFFLNSIPLLFGALIGFGTIAALFGPIKYGILPDHLETRELPEANALVEGATFLAILGGTISGGIAMTSIGGEAIVPPWAVAVLLMASPLLLRALGSRGLIAMERLMGMILVIISVQMFFDGVHTFLNLGGSAA